MGFYGFYSDKDGKKRHTQTAYSLGHDLFGVYDGDEELSSDYKNRLVKILID